MPCRNNRVIDKFAAYTRKNHLIFIQSFITQVKSFIFQRYPLLSLRIFSSDHGASSFLLHKILKFDPLYTRLQQ